MPGTTLGLIALKAFESGGALFGEGPRADPLAGRQRRLGRGATFAPSAAPPDQTRLPPPCQRPPPRADTPGVHLHHRIPHMLTPDELKALHPRRRLKAHRPPPPAELAGGDKGDENEEERGGAHWMGPGAGAAAARRGGGGGAGGGDDVAASYLWSGLVRVDVLSGPPSTALAFYGPPALRCAGLPLLQEGETVEVDFAGAGSDGEEEGGGGGSGKGSGGGSVLDASTSVAARGGLVPHDLTLRPPPGARPGAGAGAFGRGPLADVAVSGLPGWVSVSAPRGRAPLRLRVWAPRGVEVFLRPPLPSGPRDETRDGGDDEGDDGVGIGGVGGDELGKLLGLDEEDADWADVRGGLDLKSLGLEGEEDAVRQLLFGGRGMDEAEEEAEAGAADEEEGDEEAWDGKEGEEEEGEDPWADGDAGAGGWGELESRGAAGPRASSSGGGGGGGGGGVEAFTRGVSVLDALRAGGAAAAAGAPAPRQQAAPARGAARAAAGGPRPEGGDEEESDDDDNGDDEAEEPRAGPSGVPEGFDPKIDGVGEGWVTLKGIDLRDIDPGRGGSGGGGGARGGGRGSRGGGRGARGGGRGGAGGRGRGGGAAAARG
jgi:hypothetical protein